MNGIVNILKPTGMSSHQVVAFLRKQLKVKRIGHTGTLDPGASGVLPLVVGQATKLAQYLTETTKTYRAELTLGISTTTQDASGKTLELNTHFSLSQQNLDSAVDSFRGPILQIPPMASALKVDGKRLYQLERQGITVSRQPREVYIHELGIENIWHSGEKIGFGTRVLLQIVCSKGTYIRTLCHDLGNKLGVGGHMSALIRIASGGFSIEEAITLEEISSLVQKGDFSFLLPLERGLPPWVKVKVSPLVESNIAHGNFVLPEHFVDVPSTLTVGEEVVLMSVDGRILALAEMKRTDQLICQPFRVFV